jgi:HEAT repeat protein
VSSSAPIVIPSGSPPPGTPFSQHEAAAHRTLLEANGQGGGPEGWRSATRSEHPALRAAAYQLLAEDAAAEDLALFEHGLGDPDGAARAWAAFGLERLRPGAGRATLLQLAGEALEFAQYGPLIAAAALARLGDPAGLATVVRADATFDERIPVVQRLFWFARLGCPEVWPLYERALGEGPAIRELAMMQLRELGSPAAVRVVEHHVAAHPADAAATASGRAFLAEREPPA